MNINHQPLHSDRPVSDLSSRNRHLSTPREASNRPTSDIGAHYKNPEAEAIDRWFEDLSYYEQTLGMIIYVMRRVEQMAKTKLDDNFREELLAIEKWYSVLSESERTTAMYSLLQHTNPVQIRFFSQVLTQMSNKMDNRSPMRSDRSTSLSSSPNSGILHPPPRVEVTAHSPNGLLPHSPNPITYDPFAAPNSPLLRPQTPGESAISSADWSMNPPAISHSSPVARPKSPSFTNPHFNDYIPPSRGSSMGQNILGLGLTDHPHPAKGWEHTSLRPPGSPSAGYARSEYSEYSDGGGGSHGSITGNHKEKGKIPEVVDMALLEDIPAWLRSLRLHKYTPIFERLTWRQIVQFDDAKLEGMGVSALGARRKMLKVFEQVRSQIIT